MLRSSYIISVITIQFKHALCVYEGPTFNPILTDTQKNISVFSFFLIALYTFNFLQKLILRTVVGWSSGYFWTYKKRVAFAEFFLVSCGQRVDPQLCRHKKKYVFITPSITGLFLAQEWCFSLHATELEGLELKMCWDSNWEHGRYQA